MIDHLAIDVSDLTKSGHFCDQALAPLGDKKLSDAPVEFGGRLTLGWTAPLETELCIGVGSTTKPRLHITFRAKDRQQVDDFYHAALAVGGIHHGKPGLRPQYQENY
ncbi:MAG: VOC family protein [Planctomycetota bacterium]|nr:VOC family protein [Planctomycetota bacterium]